MRYLLLFLIVTVFVALAYSSPVPETEVAAQVRPGAVRKGPGGVAVGPKGRPLKKGGKRRMLQAGKGGPKRRKLQAGKRPIAGPGGKRRVMRKKRPAA